jgi:hypothetical protein
VRHELGLSRGVGSNEVAFSLSPGDIWGYLAGEHVPDPNDSPHFSTKFVPDNRGPRFTCCHDLYEAELEGCASIVLDWRPRSWGYLVRVE